MGGRVPVGWQRSDKFFIAPQSAARYPRAAARRNMLPYRAAGFSDKVATAGDKA
jgi:hypothetical protein